MNGKIMEIFPKSLNISVTIKMIGDAMQTVSIDKSGKIYLPKIIREKLKGGTYTVVVLPDETIMLHKSRQIKDPRKALQEFQKLPKVTKPIGKIKKEIHEEALRSVR